MWLVSMIPDAQIIWCTSKCYIWCILRMSWMSLKVSDPDLFLTYFSMSNISMEGLLAQYQLHKWSAELQNGTVGACGKCLRQVQRSVTFLFLTYFSRSKRSLKGLLPTYWLQNHLINFNMVHVVNVYDQFKGHWPWLFLTLTFAPDQTTLSLR